MVGNPYRWRATVSQLENRNATAGCLLTVLFVLPYLAKSGLLNCSILFLLVILYVTLVVPLAAGIMSPKSLCTFLRSTLSMLKDVERWKDAFRLVCFILSWIHFLYQQVEAIHPTVMQIVFSVAVERVMCPDQILSSLYVLLFLSVLAYLQRALQNRPWAHLHLSERSTSEFIKLTASFAIVRLGKAVVMSLFLMTFSLQFNRKLEPPFSYILITALYFCVAQYQNEPTVKSWLIQYISKMEVKWLECMEELWVPFLVSSLTISASVFVALVAIFTTDCYIVIPLLCYSNIWVPSTQTYQIWQQLSEERGKICQFPLASWKNPQVLSGNLCAICLDKLRILSARVTPCGHVFHGGCLRRSLLYTNRCPLCKSKL